MELEKALPYKLSLLLVFVAFHLASQPRNDRWWCHHQLFLVAYRIDGLCQVVWWRTSLKKDCSRTISELGFLVFSGTCERKQVSFPVQQMTRSLFWYNQWGISLGEWATDEHYEGKDLPKPVLLFIQGKKGLKCFFPETQGCSVGKRSHCCQQSNPLSIQNK